MSFKNEIFQRELLRKVHEADNEKVDVLKFFNKVVVPELNSCILLNLKRDDYFKMFYVPNNTKCTVTEKIPKEYKNTLETYVNMYIKDNGIKHPCTFINTKIDLDNNSIIIKSIDASD